MKALFDTNILIDYLNGIPQSKTELARFPDKAISIVTWMEIQDGTSAAEQTAVDHFLLGLTVLPIDSAASIKAVELRKSTKIKLPDTIIWSTALTDQRLLVTRNRKDFLPTDRSVRVPYSL